MPFIETTGAASARGFGLFATMIGDGTKGIFALGSTAASTCGVTTRDKYTYASDTSTACGVGAASTYSRQGAAAGNATRGIFQLGIAGGGYSALRNKYTYASDTSTASGIPSASGAGSQMSAAGNSTRGIFTISFLPPCYTGGQTTRNKYTYACDTSTSASGLTACSYGGAAAGNSTRGIFHLGMIGFTLSLIHI